MLAAARTQWERAKAFVPSDEQIRQRIAEREKQAGEHGHVPKTQKQIDLVRRKWLRFLDAHGEAYGYDKDAGPTLALVKHFTTCCYETREYESSLEHKGMGDSFELQLRYFLAKKVFPALGYAGWNGLSAAALNEKIVRAVQGGDQRTLEADEELGRGPVEQRARLREAEVVRRDVLPCHGSRHE